MKILRIFGLFALVLCTGLGDAHASICAPGYWGTNASNCTSCTVDPGGDFNYSSSGSGWDFNIIREQCYKVCGTCTDVSNINNSVWGTGNYGLSDTSIQGFHKIDGESIGFYQFGANACNTGTVYCPIVATCAQQTTTACKPGSNAVTFIDGNNLSVLYVINDRMWSSVDTGFAIDDGNYAGVVFPIFEAPRPTGNGVFLGYFDAPTGGNQVIGANLKLTQGNAADAENAEILYAQYSSCDSIAILDANGGQFSGACSDEINPRYDATNGWTTPNPLDAGCKPTRDGYTFNGYVGTGNGPMYYDSSLNSSTQLWPANCNVSTIKLIADWIGNCNLITFDDNNGQTTSVNVNNKQRKRTGDTDWLDVDSINQNECGKPLATNPTVQKPTNANATFLGYWTTRDTGGNAIFDENGDTTTFGNNNWTIDANTTLYARWQCNDGYAWNATTHACEQTCDTQVTLNPDSAHSGSFVGNCEYGTTALSLTQDPNNNQWYLTSPLPDRCGAIRSGYNFDGYEYNGTPYYANNLNRIGYWGLCNLDTAVLTPRWTPWCNEITFNENYGNNGVISGELQYKKTGDTEWYYNDCKNTVSASITPLGNTDHRVFKGFYVSSDNANNTNQVFGIDGQPTNYGNTWTIDADTVLYAHWDCEAGYNWDPQTKTCVQKPYEVRVKCNPSDTIMPALTYLATGESGTFSEEDMIYACKNTVGCADNYHQDGWDIYLNDPLTYNGAVTLPHTIIGGQTYGIATPITFAPHCVEDAYSVKYKCYDGDSTGKDDTVTHSSYTVQPISWYSACNINDNSSMAGYFNGWLFSGNNTVYDANDTISNWTYGNDKTFVPVYNATFNCNTDHWQAPIGENPTAQTVVLGDNLTIPTMSCVPKSAYVGWVNTHSEWGSRYAATMQTPVPGATCSSGDFTVNGNTTFNWNCPTNLTFTPDDELITKNITVICSNGGNSGNITMTYDTQNQISMLVGNWLNEYCGDSCQNPSGSTHGYWKFCGTWESGAVPNVTQMPGETNCWRAERNYDLTQVQWAKVTEFSITAISYCPKYVKYKCSADAAEVYDAPPYAYFGEGYHVLNHTTVGCVGYGYALENWVKDDNANVTFDEDQNVAAWPYDESITLVAQWKYCPNGQYYNPDDPDSCSDCPPDFPNSRSPYNWSIDQCYRQCPGTTCTDTTVTSLTGEYELQKFVASSNQIEFYGNRNLNPGTCGHATYCPYVVTVPNSGDVYVSKVRGTPVNFIDNNDDTVDMYHIVGGGGSSDDVASAFLWSQIVGPAQRYQFTVSGNTHYSVPIVYPIYSAPYNEPDGFTFNGYYNPRGGQQYVLANAVLNQTNAQSVVDDITAATGDLHRNLYAEYNYIEYSITYNCGTATGGTVPESQTGIHLNQSVTPRENTCEKPGYEFQGWVVSGTNEVKPAGSAGTFTWEYTESKTFTAKWNDEPIAYNIHYHSTDNATWGAGNHPAAYTVANLPLTIDAGMTRTHSIFMGWCTDAALTTNCEMTHTIPVGTTGDVHFWAKWKCVPPYHSNPAGTACEACATGQYWNGGQCEDCGTGETAGFPNSTPPFNWSSDQCWRECPNSAQCAVPSTSIINNIGGCIAQPFRSAASTQIEFKGNYDAGIQTCNATNVPYCPYGLDCASENVDMPRSVAANFRSGEGWPSVGTRHVVGLGNWSTGANHGTMVGGNMWSAIMGPAQEMDFDGHDPDDQYTFITYPTNMAPTATAVPGQTFMGYYDQQTGGNRRVNDDYALDTANAQSIGVTMSNLIPGDRNLYARWQQCGINTYQNGNECEPCDDGFTSPAGAPNATACTKNCSVTCTWNDSMCPTNATCTHTTSVQNGIVNQTQEPGTCYYETNGEPIVAATCEFTFACDTGYGINDTNDGCVACEADEYMVGGKCTPCPDGTRPNATHTECVPVLCDDGEYLDVSECKPCPDGYPHSDANATSRAQCYKDCTTPCVSANCPIPEAIGKCEYGTNPESGQWYFGAQACNAPGKICPMTVSCYDGYSLNVAGNECNPNQYTITYKPDENATQSETQRVTYSGSFKTKGAIFTRPGYIITAWSEPYTILDYTYPVYAFAHDTTLIAQWQQCPAGTYQDRNACTGCPAGYTSDAGTSSQMQCYRSCEKSCDDVSCPEHSVSCTKSHETYPGTQYYGASCIAETQQCTIQTVTCEAGYYLDGTECEPCSAGYSSNQGAVGADACFLVGCPVGQHIEHGECRANVMPCDVPNATVATRTWNETLRAYGSCIVAECEANYHVASNACTADMRSCSVDGGRGEQVWDGNKWGDCEITQCNPGFTDNGNACVECPNRRVNGEIAVSSYATECEIASCMYQGQKYALDGDECRPICENDSDETGTKHWDEATHKCVRTCNQGYKMW